MAPLWARRICVPTNPDLADIFGRLDFDFEIFIFWIFWTPNFWISRSPDLQIPRFPDFQVPRFPDAADGAGRILRSQPDPSPNAPTDQIRRKGPCCDSQRPSNKRRRSLRNHSIITTPPTLIARHHSWLHGSFFLKRFLTIYARS